MRPLLTFFPQWFPLRSVSLCMAALLLALVAALSGSYLKGQAEKSCTDKRELIESQKILMPLVQEIRRQKAVLAPLVNRGKPLPVPSSLAVLLRQIQQLATSAGLKEANFMPESESVVKENTIRLKGTLSAEPERFRSFLILLSDQDWIHDIETCSVIAAMPTPRFELSFKAEYADRKSKGDRP